jgi:uncharacterized membrane protein YtjA (UPF0391 family)
LSRAILETVINQRTEVIAVSNTANRHSRPITVPQLSGTTHYRTEEIDMLRWIVILLVVALAAALLGFGGIAGAAAGIAQVIFYVFLILLAISVIMGLTRGF